MVDHPGFLSWVADSVSVKFYITCVHSVSLLVGYREPLYHLSKLLFKMQKQHIAYSFENYNFLSPRIRSRYT